MTVLPKLRVVVVDDSAMVRKLLTSILSEDPEIEVVGTAEDPFDAREKIKSLNPDVLTLDIEMPRMDGLTFLRNLMRLRPMPVVMCSSLTEKGADATLEALSIGAYDFVTKPDFQDAAALAAYSTELIAKVKGAVRRGTRPGYSDRPAATESKVVGGTASHEVIAIAASTGGTEAVLEVLMQLPADSPAVVVSQHIPPVFSARFASRLDRMTALRAKEAVDGEDLLRGHVYIAPGDFHLRVARRLRYVCLVSQDAPVNRFRPSCDVLLSSVAEAVGKKSVGVVLTGMGSDGAEGLKLMRAAGAHTIAQDEDSCVVYGMPKAAARIGAAVEILPLVKIGARIVERVRLLAR